MPRHFHAWLITIAITTSLFGYFVSRLRRHYSSFTPSLPPRLFTGYLVTPTLHWLLSPLFITLFIGYAIGILSRQYAAGFTPLICLVSIRHAPHATPLLALLRHAGCHR